MASALLSILGADDVNLPDDLLPDDSYVFDYDDDCVVDDKKFKCHTELALAYYNQKHLTNYNNIVEYPRGMEIYHRPNWPHGSDLVHYGFSAAEARGEIKHFWAVLELKDDPDDREALVSSCCIVEDGLQTLGCQECENAMRINNFDPNWNDRVVEIERERMETARFMARKIEQFVLQNTHYLQDGVNWSGKELCRLEVSVDALAYYNKKHHKNYKLVDVLPDCLTFGAFSVVHCNFIARQNAPAEDVTNKLFFAELVRIKPDRRDVTACRILHGCKTTSGCNSCNYKMRRRIVHPTRGFRYGLYHRTRKSLRHALKKITSR